MKKLSTTNTTTPAQNCCFSSLEVEVNKKLYAFQNLFDPFSRKLYCALTPTLILLLFVSRLASLACSKGSLHISVYLLENELRIHVAPFKGLTIYNTFPKDRLSSSKISLLLNRLHIGFFELKSRSV